MPTLSLTVRPRVDRPIPPLRESGHGYNHDVAQFLGEYLDRPANHLMIKDIFAPLSDGSIVAAAHSVAARTTGLITRHWEDDYAKDGSERFRRQSGMSEPLLTEFKDRRATLIKQGKSIGVEFYDRELTQAEIESLLRNNVGVVSLDWSKVIIAPSFRAKLEGTPDEHLLRPGKVAAPFLYPLVPVVGFDDKNFFIQLYSQPSLALAKDVFEQARQSARVEPIFIFVSAPKPQGDSATQSGTVMETPRPLNKSEVLEKFRIAARREQRENWRDIMECYCDNHEACEFALDRAEAYGIPHQTMDELFEFVLHDAQALYPILLYKVGQSIDKALLEEIPAKDFAQALHDVIRHVREQRENSLSTDAPIAPSKMQENFERLFLGSVDQVVEYDGAGSARLADAIRYRMMDLKLLKGPEAVEQRDIYQRVPNLPAPFPAIDFEMRDPDKFKAVRPPRPGEPSCVTEVRILLEWIEEHGGEQLRNCLIQALGKGSVRIGDNEEDIFTTPMHRLSAAIKEKMNVTYFVKELCLNHGLTAWEMLSDFDAAVDASGGKIPDLQEEGKGAPSFLRKYQWEFAAGGLRQNISEVNAVPVSFRAELEYLSEILPWLVAGRVHPSMGSTLAHQFSRADHRYSNTEGQRILDTISEAKQYLKLLLDGDISISHDHLWAACRTIESREVQEKISGILTQCLSSQTPQAFRVAWKAMVQAVRPDITNESKELTEFGRLFIEFALKRKGELVAKFPAAT